jgi:DNA-binding transcriptional ArsR family regulator
MDSMITAAAHALAAGDPLGALNRIALREDAPALALRGIAMAQLGDYARSRTLLRNAARIFGHKEAVARARCIVAEAEVALVSRDLRWPTKALDAAIATLQAHGDRLNAAHAHYLSIRRMLLIGRLDDAERRLAALDSAALPPALRTIHGLSLADMAVRRLQATAAREALAHAQRNARLTAIPALMAEVDSAAAALQAPVARWLTQGTHKLLLLEEVEALLASGTLVVDAFRQAVRRGSIAVSLSTRPVLFALASALGEAWPGDASRTELAARAFRAKQVDPSHRARLRVEIGRLRSALAALADIHATRRGFALKPHDECKVAVLALPVEEKHATVLALLSDGESWSSSGLALALGSSQRTVQRTLDALAEAGKVQALGRGRARRWTTTPTPGFATTLLLPSPLPGG